VTQRVKTLDVKVLHTEGRWRVEVRSVPEDKLAELPGVRVRFDVFLSVNGCSFEKGDVAVLPPEVAVHWAAFLTVLT